MCRYSDTGFRFCWHQALGTPLLIGSSLHFRCKGCNHFIGQFLLSVGVTPAESPAFAPCAIFRPHCSTPFSSPSASPDTPQPEDGPSTSTISISPNTQHPEDGPSTSRISTLNLYSLQKIPYSFPQDQLKAMHIKDAGTFLGTSHGWPSLFVVEDDICRLCGSPLGAAKLHPGTRGGSVIYSNLYLFKEVVVKVKECCHVKPCIEFCQQRKVSL